MAKNHSWVALAVLSLSTSGYADTPPPRVELPIKEVDLSDGTRRYAVPVVIDGAAMEAGLDTGSTGLRVLAPRVPKPPTGGSYTEYSYGSGLSIKGKLNRISVQFGTAAGRLPVQLIDKLGCTASHPDCAGRKIALAEFGIQGDGLPGEGFPAILGINTADGDVINPFVALGVERWIVELPEPGSAQLGRIILDPTDEEVAGFTRLHLIRELSDRTSGVHDAVPGCLVRRDTHVKLCGPVIFDSGAPGLRVSLEGFRSPWPNGTPGQLALSDGNSSVGLDFTVGRRDQASGMFTEEPVGGLPHISAGLMPYFGWSVLYDPKSESIGLRPRR